MIITLKSEHPAVSWHVTKHGIEMNWLGGLPEGHIAWSVFQNEHHRVAVFMNPTPLWDHHVFFFSDPAAPNRVSQAFKYERGGETRPTKITRLVDPTLNLKQIPLVGKTSFAVKQLWTFADSSLRRYEEEILKGDRAVPPFGDWHFTKGRINTPEHLYSGDGVEVRLHDVSTDYNIGNQSRAYWLRVVYGQHELEVKLYKNWAGHISELHVVERLPSHAWPRAA